VWGTISKRRKVGFRIRNSVQFKLSISFFAIIAGLLILLNTYPLTVSRDLVFQSKQSTLQGKAQDAATALSTLESLSADTVKANMGYLDLGAFTRILVTNEAGLILYDTSDGGVNVGKYALFSEVVTALSGKDIFYSKFSDGAFMSRAAIPVVYSGRGAGVTTGAVYIYESDTDQAALILGLQTTFRNVSVGIFFISLILVIFFSSTLTRRLKVMLRGIKFVSDGDYNYQIKEKGNDEVAELARAFNDLTSRLQNTEEVRRRFVSDASHELKTPLASIRLLADSIDQNAEMDVDTVREFVQDIGHEADRLTRTTEKLLRLTRLAADLTDHGVPVDVKTVAEGVLHMLRPLASERNVTLAFDLADGCVISADEDDLYQIIFNLAENGIKYNRAGGTLTLTLTRPGDEAQLVIADTGIGIPEADVPHIFDRFYRVDKARSRDLGGSGLGLSIVRDMVFRHGGSVEVATRVAGGTRFTVSFPIWKEDAE